MARRTFFSFHYVPDVHRAWNVRNSWVTKDREDAGFFDNGLWEKSKRDSDDSLKTMIRNGVSGTSVICVLNGEVTYSRRWVRYEIARGVLNQNGLLTVDIHGVKNLEQKTANRGPDPLDYMGVYRSETTGNVHFCEKSNGKWMKYGDHTAALDEKLLWFGAPKVGGVSILSRHYVRYDFALQSGRNNLGEWIEDAATAVGR